MSAIETRHQPIGGMAAVRKRRLSSEFRLCIEIAKANPSP